ncbi:MAG: tripartite tricarboxylate transporter substrate binding protein [Betaproteobacteria bacterium]|nr:tripartite tricarboxylate transporter substrate binding protein [Betaproteobacteria bacterium]
MKLLRICTAFAAALLVLAPALAQQQAWPNRVVRIISTSPPGGSVDLFARIVAEEFSSAFAQTFIVENRPGANGNIGVDLVLKAPPDGHMLFVAPAGPFSINASIMESMTFNPQSDIAPVAMLGVSPLLLVVHPSVPAKDLKELLGWMKAKAGNVNYASQAVASTGFLAMELLKSLTGVQATHIPYKGSAAAATADLLAGRVSMSFVNTSTTIPHIRSGQLRAIGVAELKRIAAAPDVPTIAESGLPGFEATSWFGLGTRAGTPREVIQRLSEAAARGVTRPEVVARLGKIGIEARPMGPEQFAEFIRAETGKWGDIIRRTAAKVN